MYPILYTYVYVINILIYSSINLRFSVTHVTFPTGLISFKNAVNKYSKVNEPQSDRSKYWKLLMILNSAYYLMNFPNKYRNKF